MLDERKFEDPFWRHERIYFIEWQDFARFTEELGAVIVQSDFRPQIIFAVARGGLFPAVSLAKYFHCHDLRFLSVHRNVSEGIYSQKQDPRVDWISCASGIKDAPVLIVDDIVGAGSTLSLAMDSLQQQGANLIRSAALVRNRQSFFEPDYCTAIVDDWVVFPWEHNVSGDVDLPVIPLKCHAGLYSK